MKSFITGIALILISIFMLIFQIDNYNSRLNSIFLKYCADEASNSALLMYDELKFKEGKKIFVEEEGIKAIENVIKNYLKTDNNLMPTSDSYWKDKITYTAYFFDDDMNCKKYINGIYTDNFNFTYPYLYEDEQLSYKKTVEKANVIVTIDAGKSTYRMFFLVEPKIIRSSAYEYEV